MSENINGSGISIESLVSRLAAVELLIFLMASLFHHVLNNGEKAIRMRRELRAKTSRRAALAEELGKLAHEVNNPLGILDVSFIRLEQNVASDAPVSGPCQEKLMTYIREAQQVFFVLAVFLENAIEATQADPRTRTLRARNDADFVRLEVVMAGELQMRS